MQEEVDAKGYDAVVGIIRLYAKHLGAFIYHFLK
jgi:hypothetical protein